MLRNHASFQNNMLFAVAVPLLIVIVTAFLTLPYSLAGHPEEVRVAAYHLS